MFAKDHADNISQPADPDGPRPREIELARLRRTLFIGSLLYGTLLVALLTGYALVLLKQTATWVKALPQGVVPTWHRLMQDAPNVFYISVAGGAVGLALAATGLLLLLRVLGRDNWPPRKVVLTLAGLPMVLAVFGVGATGTYTGLGGILMFPLMLCFALAFVPLSLALMSTGLLSLALRQISQRPIPIESTDLPAAVAGYFNRHDADALVAGLMPLGDFSYKHWTKYRRFWMAPNGAYYVDATWCSLGDSIITAVCICSGTSDGHYFETTDHSPLAGSRAADSPQSLAHMTHLPEATLAELIDSHVSAVADWIERSGVRPLEHAAADVHAFTDYGVAAYMREMKCDFLWLGNPFIGQPLPPMPGRPWQAEEAATC